MMTKLYWEWKLNFVKILWLLNVNPLHTLNISMDILFPIDFLRYPQEEFVLSSQ